LHNESGLCIVGTDMTKSRTRSKGGKPALSTEAPKLPKTIAEITIERKQLTELRPHPKNPRTHPERGTAEYETLKASLEYDYFDPMVWNKRNGMLVSGHFRRRILLDMSYTAADVVVVDYDENTHLARMLAANKGLGKVNKAQQKTLFQDLLDASAKMELSGFTDKEWGKFIDAAGESLEGPQPDYPIAPILGEKHDYVIVYTANETDRAFLHSLLGIRQERSYKSTSIGLGRVVTFERFVAELVKNKESLNAQSLVSGNYQPE
jgi:hypothetical protein